MVISADLVNLGRIVDHHPPHHLPVRSVGRPSGHIQQLQDLFFFQRLPDIATNGPPHLQVLLYPIPFGDQVNVNRFAILRPHRALMHGLGGADGHAMAAVDAEVPRVRNRNGEFVFGDQSAGTGPNAAAAVDAQTLIRLDDDIHCIGGAHGVPIDLLCLIESFRVVATSLRDVPLDTSQAKWLQKCGRPKVLDSVPFQSVG